jgi:hypothetical protein
LVREDPGDHLEGRHVVDPDGHSLFSAGLFDPLAHLIWIRVNACHGDPLRQGLTATLGSQPGPRPCATGEITVAWIAVIAPAAPPGRLGTVDPSLASFMQGSFVTEIGLRQAWPFVTFCNNSLGAHGTERRLYIDAPIRTGAPAVGPWIRDDEPRILAALAQLNGLSPRSTRIDGNGSLLISFEDGSELVVSGDPDDSTTGDVWWFGPEAPL